MLAEGISVNMRKPSVDATTGEMMMSTSEYRDAMGVAFSLPGLQYEGLASLQLDRLPGQVADAYFGAGQVGHDDHSPPCRCSCGADIGYHLLVAFEITVGKVETRHVHAVGDLFISFRIYSSLLSLDVQAMNLDTFWYSTRLENS